METPQKQICSPAILLFCCSTMHHNNNIENNGKPKIVNFYNETKASVNALDQKVRHYTTYRKTSRWCMAVFYNVMDISAYNAFVLYKLRPPLQQRLPNYQKRLKFLMTLGESLIMPNMLVRASHINGFHKSTLTAMDAFGVQESRRILRELLQKREDVTFARDLLIEKSSSIALLANSTNAENI